MRRGMNPLTQTLDLVKKAQGGDRDALSRLFERYYERARRSVRARLGAKVRALRRRENLSQTQFAEKLGVSSSYVNLIENNRRPLTAPLLIRLAQIFQLDLHAFPPASGSQDVVARLDGHEAGRWNLPGWRDTQLTIELPPGPPGTSTLQLEIAAPERPVDRGLGEDDRMLGVQLRALRVVPAPARPELTLDRLGFAPGSPSLEALAGGWSEPEAAGVWSQEDHATLVFLRPESLTGALELRLKLEAFAPKAQEKQKVELWSGDRQLATWKLDDRRSDWVEAILPAGPPGAVELELRIRAPTRPVDRRIGTDTRTLGVQLQGLQAKPASWWSRLL